MVAPFVVEEYNGKFWVHYRGTMQWISGKYVKVPGELAYNKPFNNQRDAQLKANKMENKTNRLW